MAAFKSLDTIPQEGLFDERDVVVLFGELFQRGYANGVVDAALKKGMSIIYSTVGRRESSTNALRPLTDQELSEKSQPIINIPLEAGFDLDPAGDGTTPVDQIKDLKISDWPNAIIDWQKIAASQEAGTKRFRQNVTAFCQKLNELLPKNVRRILFVHTMAGGIPRAKIYMPIMNRVFKGTGDRWVSSESFWQSNLGKLCQRSFSEVTAQSFFHLIDLTQGLRDRLAASGGSVHYVAYGYHGTEVLTGDHYQWQSYSPYLQGWAKIELEDIAEKAWKKGVKATVFNCPEILTNSSSVFQGVELSLYALLEALRREGPHSPKAQSFFTKAQGFLNPGISINDLIAKLNKCLKSPAREGWAKLQGWPQHSGREQLEHQLECSDELINMQSNKENMMTKSLSEIVFQATGSIILSEMWAPTAPVYWLGHKIIAQHFCRNS